VVAGFLAVMVPTSWWSDVFLRGHGPWTTIENAFVGPMIAVVSWVCSVGNVPLAAALWHGGISFGGVVAFIFADLIAMPLILIYRKFYGGSLTIRIVAVFYAIMVAAGLVTEILFRVVGLVPTARKVRLGADRVTWNYTTFLNIVFLLVAVGLWALSRRRRHLGEESGYAIDPVCSMQVRLSDAPARTTLDGKTFYFCSDRCREKFLVNRSNATLQPVASIPLSISARPSAPHPTDATHPEFIDPICGMHVAPHATTPQRLVEGVVVYFCCESCAHQFDEQPLAR
jgi:YHS domain-containing protein